MYYFVNKEKYCQICTCPAWFNFSLLVSDVFCNEIESESFNYKSHWNILVFCGQWKMMSNLYMSKGKISDFVSFQLFGFTLVIKLRNFDFESHWNTLLFRQRTYGVRFDYVWFGLCFAVWVEFC